MSSLQHCLPAEKLFGAEALMAAVTAEVAAAELAVEQYRMLRSAWHLLHSQECMQDSSMVLDPFRILCS